jgi:hypothetical protein
MQRHSIISDDMSNLMSISQQLEKSVLSKIGVFLAQTRGPTELEEAKGFINAAIVSGT